MSGSSRTFGYVADSGDIPPTAPGGSIFHRHSTPQEDEEKCPINRNDDGSNHDLPTVEQLRQEASMNFGYRPSSSSDLHRTTYDTSKYQASQARRRMTLLLISTAVIVMVIGFGLGVSVATGWRPSNSNAKSNEAAAENGNLATNGSGSSDTTVQTPTDNVVPIDENRKAAISQLVSVRISHQEDLDTPDTPQNKALLWMTTDMYYADIPTDPHNYNASFPFIQRYVAVVLYYALNGENWVNQCEFLNTATSECDWNFYLPPTGTQEQGVTYGIQCNNNQEISDILLSSNNLKGQLPAEIGDLLGLQHLSLYDNAVTGWLPSRMQALDELWFVQLQQNQFTGAIPSWITQLDTLEYLGLRDNMFTGTIPYTLFTNASNLVEIDFAYNQLTGPIDVFDSETCPPYLKLLYLSNNKLSGRVHDASFSYCDSLYELDMSANQLTGYFPRSFFYFNIIDLHDNLLSGHIPTVYYNDSGLSYLSLANNNFSSTIPSSIINLKSIRHLDLSDNHLTGSLTDDLFVGAATMEYLLLSNNDFTPGPIPNIASAKGLTALGLSDTNRTGTIPTWIGSLPRLQMLDLHSNMLNGSIPTQLGSVNTLDYLLLNRNKLTGEVPATLTTMKDAQVFYLDNNELSGSLDFICQEITEKEKYLRFFTADCYKGAEIKCSCCSTCCKAGDTLCNNAASQAFMTHTYNNDHFIYQDNIDFKKVKPST